MILLLFLKNDFFFLWLIFGFIVFFISGSGNICSCFTWNWVPSWMLSIKCSWIVLLLLLCLFFLFVFCSFVWKQVISIPIIDTFECKHITYSRASYSIRFDSTVPVIKFQAKGTTKQFGMDTIFNCCHRLFFPPIQFHHHHKNVWIFSVFFFLLIVRSIEFEDKEGKNTFRWHEKETKNSSTRSQTN